MGYPRHVAIIMDGNGRWAKQRGLERFEGHRVGAESVRDIIEISVDVGVEYLTLYTFSTENWKRPKEEVYFLMRMLVDLINEETPELKRNGVRFDVIGNLNIIPQEVMNSISLAKEETKDCKRLKLFLALSYGGRTEIIDGINKLLKENKTAVSEEEFTKYLYKPDVPFPDMLIRTGGERRISNFLLYQIAYTELFFVEKYWPDFREDDYLQVLKQFSERRRRFGGI